MDRVRVVGIVALLVAASLFAAPSLLWPNYAETPQYVWATETDEAGHGDVVAYEDLSDGDQAVFQEARTDGSGPLYSGSDGEALSTFSEYRYVEYEGQLYRMGIDHADGAWFYEGLLRLAMFGTGLLVGVLGVVLTLVGGRSPGSTRVRTNESSR